MLSRYLDGQPVKPNSFASNPQSYANWIENQEQANGTYHSVDFSKLDHQKLIVSELAEVVAFYRREGVLTVSH